MLNFRDSDRESVLSYFINNGKHKNQMDTPTRILNKSNDFLPITYDERLQKAIDNIEKEKEEEAKEKKKRTKSV